MVRQLVSPGLFQWQRGLNIDKHHTKITKWKHFYLSLVAIYPDNSEHSFRSEYVCDTAVELTLLNFQFTSTLNCLRRYCAKKAIDTNL